MYTNFEVNCVENSLEIPKERNINYKDFVFNYIKDETQHLCL